MKDGCFSLPFWQTRSKLPRSAAPGKRHPPSHVSETSRSLQSTDLRRRPTSSTQPSVPANQW